MIGLKKVMWQNRVENYIVKFSRNNKKKKKKPCKPQKPQSWSQDNSLSSCRGIWLFSG